MFKPSKQRLDWEMYDQLILEAIREIEYLNPFTPVTVSQIQKKLKEIKRRRNVGKIPSRRSIYNHLYGDPYANTQGLLERKLVFKIGRGSYSSKMAMIAKKFAQEFIVRESYETVPRLDGERFNEFLSRHLSTTKSVKEEYMKKRKFPLLRHYYDRKLKNVIAKEKVVKSKIQTWLRNDLEFIENSTEITLLSSKKLPYLNTEKIRETLAEVLYFVLAHERRLAEQENREFALENFGLNIIVSFNPKKAGKPPSPPTLKELRTRVRKLAILGEERQKS